MVAVGRQISHIAVSHLITGPLRPTVTCQQCAGRSIGNLYNPNLVQWTGPPMQTNTKRSFCFVLCPTAAVRIRRHHRFQLLYLVVQLCTSPERLYFRAMSRVPLFCQHSHY